MDGESGIMWQMVMLVMHVRDTFDRGGSAVSCWQQLTRGEASWAEAAFPRQGSSYFHSPPKVSHDFDRIGLFSDPAVKFDLEQMCRRELIVVPQIER